MLRTRHTRGKMAPRKVGALDASCRTRGRARIHWPARTRRCTSLPTRQAWAPRRQEGRPNWHNTCGTNGQQRGSTRPSAQNTRGRTERSALGGAHPPGGRPPQMRASLTVSPLQERAPTTRIRVLKDACPAAEQRASLCNAGARVLEAAQPRSRHRVAGIRVLKDAQPEQERGRTAGLRYASLRMRSSRFEPLQESAPPKCVSSRTRHARPQGRAPCRPEYASSRARNTHPQGRAPQRIRIIKGALKVWRRHAPCNATIGLPPKMGIACQERGLQHTKRAL